MEEIWFASKNWQKVLLFFIAALCIWRYYWLKSIDHWRGDNCLWNDWNLVAFSDFFSVKILWFGAFLIEKIQGKSEKVENVAWSRFIPLFICRGNFALIKIRHINIFKKWYYYIIAHMFEFTIQNLIFNYYTIPAKKMSKKKMK